MGAALVLEIELELAAGLLGGDLEVALLQRGGRGSLPAVRGGLVQEPAVDLDVGGVGDVLAADLGLVVAAAADHEHDPDHDRQGEDAGDDVAEHQPAALGGRGGLLGGEALGAAALAFGLR